VYSSHVYPQNEYVNPFHMYLENECGYSFNVSLENEREYPFQVSPENECKYSYHVSLENECVYSSHVYPENECVYSFHVSAEMCVPFGQRLGTEERWGKKKKGRRSESPRDTPVAFSSFGPNPRGNRSHVQLFLVGRRKRV